MGRRFCVLASLTFIIAVILLSPELSPGANPKVRVGLPDFTSSSVPFEIARRMGYFSQEGLDVDIIRMSCAVSVRALAFIIAGHERHHVGILKTRYLS